jgi:hypothetical protein
MLQHASDPRTAIAQYPNRRYYVVPGSGEVASFVSTMRFIAEFRGFGRETIGVVLGANQRTNHSYVRHF